MSVQLEQGQSVNLSTGQVDVVARPVTTIAGRSYVHPRRVGRVSYVHPRRAQ